MLSKTNPSDVSAALRIRIYIEDCFPTIICPFVRL
jgi:hypothetical protein